MIRGVHRYLVTAPTALGMHKWTAVVANWLEWRLHNDRHTFQITVFEHDKTRWLEACELLGLTVEEIHGAGDTETYELVSGKPGTGWKN